MRKRLALIAAVPAALGLLAGAVPATAADDRPVVYTTFYPTQYLTQRIGGDLIEVVNPVPENADPIFWEPTREDLRAYQRADLIVLTSPRPDPENPVALLGSLSHKIGLLAPCPVLLVK